ncbi:MAG: PPC domain-containing protein [Candidatus Sumerlaeaceae bacterium]
MPTRLLDFITGGSHRTINYLRLIPQQSNYFGAVKSNEEMFMKLRYLSAFILCMPVGIGWSVSEGLEDGSNNVRGGAVSFTVPDTLTGTLAEDGAGGEDFFRWTATAGTQYNFNATTSGLPQLDIGIEIQNSAGTTQPPVHDSGGAGQAEVFSFTPSSSGTYYVDAYRADNVATGASYSIAVSAVSGINDWNLY